MIPALILVSSITLVLPVLLWRHSIQVKRKRKNSKLCAKESTEPPWTAIIATYAYFARQTLRGRVADAIGKITTPEKYRHLQVSAGYAPLNDDFADFFTRRIKGPISDCFARVVVGTPTQEIALMTPHSSKEPDSQLSSTNNTYLNIGSYNYLGFSQSSGEVIESVIDTINQCGLSWSDSHSSFVRYDMLERVEQQIADFIGKPAAIIFSMGFSTNTCGIPPLLDSRSLVIGDESNHNSIRIGCRVSGATVLAFKHNDMEDLERVIRCGFEKYRPRKIIVIVEGLYSMEGTLCDLRGILQLKRKYKFFLFIDEAHSIGSVGKTGRGITEYLGVRPDEVDVLMGTFSKSFAAVGGYIAASNETIATIRESTSTYISELPTPAVLQQITSTLEKLSDRRIGPTLCGRLRQNARYLRVRLAKSGFILLGSEDSPVIPLLIFNIGKVAVFSRELLKRGIAVVVVGFPATTLHTSRARFCVSACHTKSDLDHIASACQEVGAMIGIDYHRSISSNSLK